MKKILRKITPAILESRKIRVFRVNGEAAVVGPHIVVRKKGGKEILKSVLEDGSCLDIPLKDIADVDILPDNFALDSTCLSFDYDEYELVFPRREDWVRFSRT